MCQAALPTAKRARTEEPTGQGSLEAAAGSAASSSTCVNAPCLGSGLAASCGAGSAAPDGGSEGENMGGAALGAGAGTPGSVASPSHGALASLPGFSAEAAEEGSGAPGASAGTCGGSARAGSCAGLQEPDQAVPAEAAGSTQSACTRPPCPEGLLPATGPSGDGTAAVTPGSPEGAMHSLGSEQAPLARGGAASPAAPGPVECTGTRALGLDRETSTNQGPVGALGVKQGASAAEAPGAGAGAVAGKAEGAAGEVFPLSLEWLRQEPEEDLRRILMGIAGAAWVMARPRLYASAHTDVC